jgi:hypothetical protein
MKVSYDFHDNNSLDFSILRSAILCQAVGRSDRTTAMMVICRKEITMHAHENATTWGTHISVGPTRDGKGWYQRLRG